MAVLFALLLGASSVRAEEPKSAAPETPAAGATTRALKKAKKAPKKQKSKKAAHAHNSPNDDDCAEIGRAWLAKHPEAVARLPAPSPDKAAADVAPRAIPAVHHEPVVVASPPGNPPSTSPEPGLRRPVAPFAASDRVVPSSSIYRVDMGVDGVVIATGAVASILPFVFQDQIIRPRGLGSITELNSLDQHVVGNSSKGMALASNVTTLAALALPVAVDLVDVGWSRELFEDGVVMSEVLAMTGAGVTFAKYTTQRRSPSLYLAGNTAAAANTSNYRSFVSWQTATTFASLSALSFTLSQRHEYGGWAWLGTALIGGSVAAERVASGGAFYTDVIGGALIGLASGTIVPWLHLNTRYNWTIAPGPNGVTFGGSGRF